MIALVLLMACRGAAGPEGTAPAGTDPTTPAPITTPAPTTTPTTEAPQVEVARVDDHAIRVGLAGVHARCDGTDAVAAMEFVGNPDDATVTAYIGGEAGDTWELPLEAPGAGAFQLVEHRAALADCADASFVWELHGLDYHACVVTGADALALADALGGDCRTW